MFSLVSSTRELAAYRARLRWFGALAMLACTVLVGRIGFMQLVRGDSYSAQSRDNFMRKVRLEPDRGLIRDSRGRIVAHNRPSYTVTVTPHFVDSGDGQVLERVIRYVGLEGPAAQNLRDKVASATGYKRLEPIRVGRDVHRDALAVIETNRRELPGVDIVATSHREYPAGKIASHLIGYMNQISGRELADDEFQDYVTGDYIGRSGVERALEHQLRGYSGVNQIVVDAIGQRRDLRSLQAQEDRSLDGVLGEVLDAEQRFEPRPGHTVVLTADMKLQRIMEQAMRRHPSGAIVAVEPDTGKILGMYSKPTFNPASWTGRLSFEEKKAVDDNPYKPMMNKSVWSYFPGSTWKIVTAMAALEEGVVSTEEEFECRGYHMFGNRTFRCWNRAGHGMVNLHQAMKQSCDVWFYVAGERLGIDRLAEYARAFGFGDKTGLGLNGEAAGLVPTRKWHEKHSSEGFQHGFALNTAVGQGDVRASPLQVAMAYSAIANGGYLYFPQIIGRVETADGQLVKNFRSRLRGRLPGGAETIQVMVDGMLASVQEEDGTAYAARLENIAVVGKTGTAQVRNLDALMRMEEEERYRHRDHAWFAGYAPADDPQIVVVAFLEHGGSGGRYAAPVAMEVIHRYFRDVVGVIPAPRTAAVDRGVDRVAQ